MENENALTVLPFSTPVGLNLPADFSIVAWAGYARAIKVWDCAGQFFLGDLMLYSQSKGADYEQEATQIAANLRFEPRTLQNCMYMARRFPAVLRRPGVEYSLYREVASLPNEEAMPLLEMAIKNDWGRRELAAEVRRQKGQKIPKRGGDVHETIVSPSNADNGRMRDTVPAELHNARAVEVEAVDVSNGDKTCTPGVQAETDTSSQVTYTPKVEPTSTASQIVSEVVLERPFFEEKDIEELEEALFAGEKPSEQEVLRLIADIRHARLALKQILIEVIAISESPAAMGNEDIERLGRIGDIIEGQLGTQGEMKDAEADAG